MGCIKCGKKTEGTDVFCPACLEEMKRYPIKRAPKIQIPVRPEPTERKQTRPRKERTAEEQVTALHKLVQTLVILSAALATTLAVVTGTLVYTIVQNVEPEQPVSPMSRNYTSAPLDGE